MYVNCFTLNSSKVKKTFFNSSKIYVDNIDDIINIIYAEFGQNIPKYFKYSDDHYIKYLFCVDKYIDVVTICKKNNFTIDNLYEMEIEFDTYNNDYTIYPTYDSDNGSYYILKKN